MQEIRLVVSVVRNDYRRIILADQPLKGKKAIKASPGPQAGAGQVKRGYHKHRTLII